MSYLNQTRLYLIEYKEKFWAGADQWSPDCTKAVLFQSYESALAQVQAMNLDEWAIRTLNEYRFQASQ